MNSGRIAELLQPFLRTPIAGPQVCQSEPATAGEESALLSPAQLQSISTYIDILIRWNARINLTAVGDPEEIVTRHFGESLFAARHLFPDNTHLGNAEGGGGNAHVGNSNVENAHAGNAHVGTAAPGCPAERSSAALAVADIGSGAGFPGLPLKLWAPHIALTLIESNHKKAIFLREVTRALTLTDVNIQNARAETLTGRTFNVVTLRAVERFESILPVAAALIAPAGRLALLISASQQLEAQAKLSQFIWCEPIPIPLSRTRILLTARQTGTSFVTSGK